MPRTLRIIIPEEAHHITQRGNYRQEVFEVKQDFQQYLIWLNEYSQKYQLRILAYCLMSNHVHLIAIPQQETSLGRTLNTLTMRYAQYINRKRRTYGHLWQGRYFSCLLDEAHLYRAIRYVERNPVRAKLVPNAWEYVWSSAAAHIGMPKENGISLYPVLELNHTEWREYLQEEDEELTQDIRLKTQRGLVVGKEAFINKVEKRLKRSLKCLNPGRPKKKGS